MENRIEIRPSTIAGAGNGVFATGFIPAGTTICEYEGRLCLTRDDETDQSRSYTIDGKWVIIGDGIGATINDSVEFRPLSYDETVLFFTQKILPHSTQHNCHFDVNIDKKQVWIIATRDIAPGEELFADYGFRYWATRVLHMRFVDYRYPVDHFRF